jgi:hypothetical protein
MSREATVGGSAELGLSTVNAAAGLKFAGHLASSTAPVARLDSH